MSSNGDFELGKPPKTGGIISEAVVSEQILYEVGDPGRYMLPDVNCDFTNVKLKKSKDFNCFSIIILLMYRKFSKSWVIKTQIQQIPVCFPLY